MTTNGTAALPTKSAGRANDQAATGAGHLTSAAVWKAITRASFAVIGYANPAGEPRSSGVVYAIVDRRLYIAVEAKGWKARHIATGQLVTVTVPVRRGGILAMLMPIPPATVTFEARATVHPAGSLDVSSVSKELTKLVPDDRKSGSCIIELAPEGRFLTYGIGVSLMAMRNPAVARARVPIA